MSIQWSAIGPMGFSRSRRPLPRTRTNSWSESRSSRFNPTNSLTRNRELGLIISSHAVMSAIAGTFASDFRNGKHWSST